MSTFVEPQLARPFTIEKFKKKTWGEWVMEPKHDGMRAIVSIGVDEVEVYSRSGKVYATHVPELVALLSYLPAGTVLDGELAVVDDTIDQMYIDGNYNASVKVPVVNFNKTMRIMGTGFEKAVARQDPKDETFVGKMSFIAFDLLFLGEQDLREATQLYRNIMLTDLVMKVNSLNFTRNPILPVDLAIYDELVAKGVEGVILKNLNGLYSSGRNSDWLKLKSEKTFDVVVTGFTDAKEGKTGKFAGKIGAIEFSAYLPDGTLQYVGRCSGMDDTTRDSWTIIRDNWGSHQYDDILVIEVKANEMVGSGEYKTPRHPQYVTQRIDKDAKDCLMEQFKS